MKIEVRGTQIEIEPNSKPFLLKRLLADGFDVLTVFFLYLLFTFLILETSLAATYRTHYEQAAEIAEETAARLGNDTLAIRTELLANEEYLDESFAANLHGYLLKGLAVFLAEAILLLAIPLSNRDKATLGKKLTGVLLFSETRQAKAKWFQIVSRFLFVFLLDSLLLFLLTGTLTFLLVPVLRLTEMLMNRKNKTICDFVTGLMVIEKASYDGVN